MPYVQKNANHPRSHKNKIFNKYEVYQLFSQINKQMIQMKPVMMQDFDFMLLHTY